jgi:hypothetical protein
MGSEELKTTRPRTQLSAAETTPGCGRRTLTSFVAQLCISKRKHLSAKAAGSMFLFLHFLPIPKTS